MPAWSAQAQRDEIAVRSVHNTNMAEGLVGAFGFNVTVPASDVEDNPNGAHWEDSTEHGEPVGSRRARPALKRGYTLRWMDAATRWSRRAWWRMTPEEFQKTVNDVLVGDRARVQRELGRAVYVNTARANEDGTAVYPLYNGDAEVPSAYDGREFTAPHNHYATTAALAVDGSDLTWLVRTVTWTPPALTGQVAVVCRGSGSAQVRATSAGVR
ncbi:hypothetical protein [Cellulomonas palmilytica]|uniref:hypothetical protein n=1 Tax=Cellulomonas palmilytica TaxID=2608402 RepID=UPI001F344EC0|nr:hypothetical protein [Cellulomonas palmilytica]UJP40815.1 hypothetical protein F1D97_04835 [Cellulomonas palmilytica]